MFPKVSVIVPVYNCERYLSECLDSILVQTYPNMEIIIVNDGSKDGSEKIINKYKAAHKGIKYYFQENSGPSEARNKAIINATGEYLVFIDSDDTVEKKYIESLLKKMINSGSDIVCCGYKDISQYGISNHSDFNFEGTISLHTFIEMVCNGTGGVLWGKIFKKEIILKNNLLMDKKIFMSEDLVFVLRYAAYCTSFAVINEYLYNYNRLNQASISSNKSIKYIENYICVCRYLDEILNSVCLDKNKINNIITNKLQDIVINIVEQQSENLKAIGWKNAIENVFSILSLPYIQKYKANFATNRVIYIPFLYLLKNNLVKSSIIYGIHLKILRCIKNILQKRK